MAGPSRSTSTLVSGGVTSANDSGLWTGTAGNLTLVAREGDVAPGSGGQTFGAFSANVFLNAAGQVLFPNALSGGAYAQSMLLLGSRARTAAGVLPERLRRGSTGRFRTLIQVAAGSEFERQRSRPLCFANDGTVTLRPSFSDGSCGDRQGPDRIADRAAQEDLRGDGRNPQALPERGLGSRRTALRRRGKRQRHQPWHAHRRVRRPAQHRRLHGLHAGERQRGPLRQHAGQPRR